MSKTHSPFFRMLRTPLGFIGTLMLLLFVLLGVFGPLIGSSPDEISSSLLTPPNGGQPFGTDDLGRSVLAQVISGARTSLLVAVVSSVIAIVVGTTLGLLGAYFRRVDPWILGATDVMLSLPMLPLMIVAAAFAGASTTTMMIVIGLTSWPQVVRLVRSGAKTVASMPYIDAARMTGSTNLRVLVEELLPAVIPLVTISVLLVSSKAIIAEASLSFLGLDDPTAWSWGRILQQAQSTGVLSIAWWQSLFPSLCILAAALAMSVVGNAYSDARNETLLQRSTSGS